jgi:putative glutamine amidotransferase
MSIPETDARGRPTRQERVCLESNDQPLIGVTLHGEAMSERAPRFAGPRAYFEAVQTAGAAPLGIPPLPGSLRVLYDLADGVLLTGGGDIDPVRYGESPVPQLGPVDPERDEAELTLARWALEDDKPLLAICRGEQVLNVAAGGSLYQDLPTQWPKGVNHNESRDRGIRGLATHVLDVVPGTRLEEAVGSGALPVNTHHHQAVKELGAGLVVSGRAEDGVVEAIESAQHGWIVGIQCHPEMMWHEHAWAARLFSAFVAEVRYRAARPEPRVIGALKRATG